MLQLFIMKKTPDFICKVCEKAFVQPHFLRRHIQVDHRDNCCDECDDYFSSTQSLIQHIKANHLGEDRTCVVCNKKFESFDACEAHMRSSHPQGSKDGKDQIIPSNRDT